MTTAGVANIYPKEARTKVLDSPLKHCRRSRYITMFNAQNVTETRLAKRYYFEAGEFENDVEIFSLALVFELQLWPEISLFSTKH